MQNVQFIRNADWKAESPDWCPVQDILVQHLPDGGSTENHYHDFHEYYIACSGQADIVLENQRFLLRPGEVAAIHCGARHHLENATGDFCYVALRDARQGLGREGRILDPNIREFVGMQGRYIDGPVTEDEIAGDRCAVLQARAWFWLRQKPSWAWMTSLGQMDFADGADEPDYHKHECDEIYLCVSGHMTALVGGVSYEMHEGDIITIPTGTFHRVTRSHGISKLAYFYGELQGMRRYGHLEDGRDPWVL